jgi:molybdate transport system substrate-binding protein
MVGTDIIVLCTLGLAGVMNELVPQFERETGHRLAMRFGPTNLFKPEIAAGAEFDVTVLTAPVIDEFIAQGKIVPGTRVDIAKSRVGVTVRPGAPKPDIGSVEAFRRTLLDAKSIVFTGQGASGQHFASLLPKLGVEAEVRAKALVMEGLVATKVVSGEIELGIQQVSEILAVPGAVLVGPIPDALQNVTVFSAGLGRSARDPAAARALLSRLAAPETLTIAKSKGMERP